MSRIGKMPIALPKGVKATLAARDLLVEGPKGKLTIQLEPMLDVKVEGDKLSIVIKDAKDPRSGARHGLTRSLVANMVKGVSEGYTENLEINGVGYRANLKGQELELLVGFSHPILYKIPVGITIVVEKQTKLAISGADMQLVGQTAAEIRRYREPEPYKGKGIKYVSETIRRKAGKAAASAAS